jgi:hypothetical protein
MSPPNDRDEAILEHVRRYHLTTAEVLKRHFFAETNDAAVRKVVSRLIHERRLRAFNLFDNRKYYVLTPREAVARCASGGPRPPSAPGLGTPATVVNVGRNLARRNDPARQA